MDHVDVCSGNESPEHSLHGKPHVQLSVFPDQIEQMKKLEETHKLKKTWLIDLYYTILTDDLWVSSC